jgi:hypothetical protein
MPQISPLREEKLIVDELNCSRLEFRHFRPIRNLLNQAQLSLASFPSEETYQKANLKRFSALKIILF